LLGTISAVAPTLDILVQIESDNVTFDGIEFQCSKWFSGLGKITFQADSQIYLSSADPRVTAAVKVTNCANAKLIRCKFKNLGGNALELARGSNGAIIEGNRFDQIAGGGIVMCGPRVKAPQYTSEHPELAIDLVSYVANPPLVDQCRNHQIRNNRFTNYAQEYYGSAAIFSAYVNTYWIENNEIGTGPSYPISAGWGWGDFDSCHTNAIIKNNRIIDPFRQMTDGGAIYTLGKAPNSEISGNYITGVSGNGFSYRDVCVAIYLDAGTNGYTVYNNAHASITQIGGVGGGSGGPEDFVGVFFSNAVAGANNAANPSVIDTDPSVALVVSSAGLQNQWNSLKR
jgi:hypothetical protein